MFLTIKASESAAPTRGETIKVKGRVLLGVDWLAKVAWSGRAADAKAAYDNHCVHHMMLIRIVLILLAWGWLGCPPAWAAESLPDDLCLGCHEDDTYAVTDAADNAASTPPDAAKPAASVHKTNTCASCHADITEQHPDNNVAARPVDCGQCHGRAAEGYRAGVHGLALARGQDKAATCADCHGAHNILPLTAPASPLHVARQAKTCGACHDQAARDVEESSHGKALAAGNRDAPACADCHSEHKADAPGRRSAAMAGVEICGRCHASERLNARYRLPLDRVETFLDSYHGLAIQHGSTVAANCASCHGAHRILPSTDPRSSIHKTNLVVTCGKCHPGATDNFARGKVHVDAAAAGTGASTGEQINRWVRRIYVVLIAGVIALMLAHNLLLFGKKVWARYRAADLTVRRMSRSQRLQHLVLTVSFIVLALTGFALKFPDSMLARALGSNEVFRSVAHRAAGVALLLVAAYHAIYLLTTREGRQLAKDFRPIRQDLKDLLHNARHLTGLGTAQPKIGRFGYVEKVEYWGVVWGTIIMGATGLMVWGKIEVTRFMPRWALDVALTIHYYEAILACLTIVVWHFYHVILDPDVYPLNWACWNGKVSRRWQEEHHPLEPSPQSGATPATGGGSPSGQKTAVSNARPPHSSPPSF